MNKNIIGGTVGIALLALAYYMVTADSRRQGESMMTYEESAPENTYMGDGMEHGNDDLQGGTSERAFLEHMIPHHQEAVDTAKEVLARGGTLPEIKELASDIIAAQEKEITDMKSWYAAWYQKEYVESTEPMTMMRDLEGLSGADLDKKFLEEMIAHHMNALEQGQLVAKTTTKPEIIKLATDIAESQSEEIITMRILLKQLPE
jgi:uncharacterized protein (DUF305 family)